MSEAPVFASDGARALAVVAASLLTGIAIAGGPVVRCVDPGNNACFRTIQAAVDAAGPGEVVEIQPHPQGSYEETVVVATAGLTVRGASQVDFTVETLEDLMAIDWASERRACSDVRIDVCDQPAFPGRCAFDTPDALAFDHPAFLVTAADVTLSDLTIRHGFTAVRATDPADGLELLRNCFIRDRVAVDAREVDLVPKLVDDLVFSRNRLFSIDGRSKAVQIFGNRASIDHNLLLLSNGIEIRFADAGGATITRNAIVGTEDREAIDLPEGSGHLIEENYLAFLADDAITLDSATNSTIRGNHIFSTPEDGISESGADTTIANNTVVGASAFGILSAGEGVRVTGNLLISSGGERPDPCVAFSGTDALVADNDLLLCSRGIDAGLFSSAPPPATASNNVISENRIDYVTEGGIVIADQRGTGIEANEIIEAHLVGFRNEANAVDTTVSGNTITGSRQDVCSDGTIAVFTDNTIDTGGPAVICIEIN